MSGKQYLQAAMLIGAVAPGYEIVRFTLDRIPNSTGEEVHRPLTVLLAFGLGALAVLLILGWLTLPLLIEAIAGLVRAVFAPHVPRWAWDEATEKAMAVLPGTVTVGVLMWLVYSIGGFGGWPDDVIFGTLGHLTGAWCYFTLIAGWWKVSQQYGTVE